MRPWTPGLTAGSRREFLATTAKLGIGAAVLAKGMTPSSYDGGAAAAPGGRTIQLEAREITWELAPGKTIKALAYNGRVPGPEIRAREGERIRVVLKNSLAEPTTIHWHGVDVPNAMDGVPDLTQKPVNPGETFVYEFDARPAGTRWYHTHFREHRQMDLGLVAPLIVEPADREPMASDRELTLVLDDWATGTGKPLADTAAGTGTGGMGGMMGGTMRGGGMGGMMQGMMGRRAHEPAYDTMTINGKAWPATEPVHVERGERVRLRIINASAEHTHVLRLAGHRVHVTHTDGNALVAPVEVDALPIAPSERYDVVIVAARPGAWFLQCLQPGHAEAGERIAVLYRGQRTRNPETPDPDLRNAVVWGYHLGRGRVALPTPDGTTKTSDLVLSGGMMGSDVWTINRKVYPNTDPLHLDRGDRAVVRLVNMSPEAHPMHLHGQSFRVLGVGRTRFSEPVVKDSVDIAAHMGSAVLEFTAHNVGDWLFHCHKPMHMEGGMVMLVKIG
jgi:FtsP/CotA-like multicopper oxidase with cupredoxin domain